MQLDHDYCDVKYRLMEKKLGSSSIQEDRSILRWKEKID